MAMSPAERQRRRRERLKAEGIARRDGQLEPEEQIMLRELCTGRRPGKEPYTENELLGLLIRQNHAEYRKQLLQLSKTPCKKCGETPPVSSCPCAGDSQCWATRGYQKLEIKL
ncbi:hypothetical protein F0327_25335 [Citrobacter braakii]|nr:hypothetical protein F0327_25335 [Citrobacter braakii]